MHRYRSIIAAVATVVGVVGIAAGAFAAKPQSAWVVVSFTAAPTTSGSTPYGTPYVVSGCGYDAANGGVTVVVHGPEAMSFAGQTPDSNGCISVTNFSTQGPGSYAVDAYQQLHNNNKSSLMASTSFTLN